MKAMNSFEMIRSVLGKYRFSDIDNDALTKIILRNLKSVTDEEMPLCGHSSSYISGGKCKVCLTKIMEENNETIP
jgi:tRNA(Ile2) C34 agmatinyltransferase TiaS